MFFHGNTYEFFGNTKLIRMYSESSMQLDMHPHSNQKKNHNSSYSQEDVNALL